MFKFEDPAGATVLIKKDGVQALLPGHSPGLTFIIWNTMERTGVTVRGTPDEIFQRLFGAPA